MKNSEESDYPHPIQDDGSAAKVDSTEHTPLLRASHTMSGSLQSPSIVVPGQTHPIRRISTYGSVSEITVPLDVFQ